MGLTTRLGMRNGNDFSALPSSIQHHHHTPTYTTRSLVTTDTPSQWPYRYSTLLLVLFSFSGSRFCSYCKAFNTTTRLEAFRPRRFLLEYTWKATHLKLVFVSGCLLVWLGTGIRFGFYGLVGVLSGFFLRSFIPYCSKELVGSVLETIEKSTTLISVHIFASLEMFLSASLLFVRACVDFRSRFV